ncbi:hypothetical protein [Kocuria rosea]|uniref:Uncharacterized protein n=1 Tax=Kocuria rosea TaxID=1275 RepID=A0A4V3B3X1_KOCRO|nr:hypothetical protein [Kocuria rosea]TDL46503.1 hypothetical protein E2R59_00310 [Kocuria rosea]
MVRLIGLAITGIGGGVATVAGMITWIVETIGFAGPLGDVAMLGWLAFPAGLLALAGLVILLADVLVMATATAAPEGAAAPQPSGTQRTVRVLRLGLWAYATFLFLGALSAIAYRVYNPVGIEVGYGVFLLLCAVFFTWGVTRLRGSVVSQGEGANTGEGPASGAVRRAERQVVRQWGMAATGIGAGVVVATFWFSAFIDRFFWSGVLFGPAFFTAFGFAVAACGLVVVLVDGLLRLTGRRY